MLAITANVYWDTVGWSWCQQGWLQHAVGEVFWYCLTLEPAVAWCQVKLALSSLCVLPQQAVGGATVEHLSLLAHLSSLSLCHPPLTMVAPANSQLPRLRPFRPLGASLPCDIHLLNLRTLEDAQVHPAKPTKQQMHIEKNNPAFLFGLANRKLEIHHRKWLYSSIERVLTVPLFPRCHYSARGVRKKR